MHTHTHVREHTCTIIFLAHEDLAKVDSEVVHEEMPLDVCITNDDFKVPYTNSQTSQLSYTYCCYYQQALTTVQPSAKREGFASVPDATWDDIGALDHIKEELALCILVCSYCN